MLLAVFTVSPQISFWTFLTLTMPTTTGLMCIPTPLSKASFPSYSLFFENCQRFMHIFQCNRIIILLPGNKSKCFLRMPAHPFLSPGTSKLFSDILMNSIAVIMSTLNITHNALKPVSYSCCPWVIVYMVARDQYISQKHGAIGSGKQKTVLYSIMAYTHSHWVTLDVVNPNGAEWVGFLRQPKFRLEQKRGYEIYYPGFHFLYAIQR